MYYNRYLSLFVLEEFPGVVRDTARNLRVLDLCGKFAADEQDRLVLEQYRPYITMMNARANASIQFKDSQYKAALQTVERGLADIKDFFARFGQEEAYPQSNEVRVLSGSHGRFEPSSRSARRSGCTQARPGHEERGIRRSRPVAR